MQDAVLRVIWMYGVSLAYSRIPVLVSCKNIDIDIGIGIDSMVYSMEFDKSNNKNKNIYTINIYFI